MNWFNRKPLPSRLDWTKLVNFIVIFSLEKLIFPLFSRNDSISNQVVCWSGYGFARIDIASVTYYCTLKPDTQMTSSGIFFFFCFSRGSTMRISRLSAAFSSTLTRNINTHVTDWGLRTLLHKRWNAWSQNVMHNYTCYFSFWNTETPSQNAALTFILRKHRLALRCM